MTISARLHILGFWGTNGNYHRINVLRFNTILTFVFGSRLGNFCSFSKDRNNRLNVIPQPSNSVTELQVAGERILPFPWYGSFSAPTKMTRKYACCQWHIKRIVMTPRMLTCHLHKNGATYDRPSPFNSPNRHSMIQKSDIVSRSRQKPVHNNYRSGSRINIGDFSFRRK
jgi:hypothetical protein